MTPAYSITIDLDDGGPALDISADVRALEWRLGADDPAEALAPPGRARIAVYHPDPLRYAPDAPSAPRLVGRWLTIRSDDGVAERTLFSGMIEAVAPAAGPEAAGQALLHAVTTDAGLAEMHAQLPPAINATAATLINALLADLPLRRPALYGLWVLEAPGFSELESTTRPAASFALPFSGDSGISLFAWAALGGWRADDALRQIVVSEGGRCAVNRGGVLNLWDRHHGLHALAPSATFDSTMHDLQLTAGERWANQVTARFYPVVIGAPDTPLWSLERPQKLPPGVRRMQVSFRDAAGLPCAAWQVARLTASASTAPDGSGSPLPVEALIAAADSRSATLEFRNPGPASAWLMTDTCLLGTPLSLDVALEVEQSDWTSRTFYGPRQRTLDLPLIGALDEADSRARFELLRAPVPRARVMTVEFDLRAVPAALGLTMGDRIVLNDPTTGTHAACDVIGEAHTVDEGGARHRVRLVLDPAPQTRFWEIGLCALASETALAH